MAKKEEIVRKVQGALEHEPRINLHRCPVKIDLADGAVVLEGEVQSGAAKKLALELAAAVGDIRGGVDRLRIVPAERRGDGAIRDSLCGLLLQEERRQAELDAWALFAVDKVINRIEARS